MKSSQSKSLETDNPNLLDQAKEMFDETWDKYAASPTGVLGSSAAILAGLSIVIGHEETMSETNAGIGAVMAYCGAYACAVASNSKHFIKNMNG